MTGLRKEAREAGVYVRVVRNTLLKRAVEGTQYDVLNDVLTGGGGRRQGVVEAMAKSAMRSMGSQVGRALVRGVLGSLLKR